MDAAMKEFLGIGESLTFYSLIVDFAIASLFLLIGQLIRAKVKIVQKFSCPRVFWPASWVCSWDSTS